MSSSPSAELGFDLPLHSSRSSTPLIRRWVRTTVRQGVANGERGIRTLDTLSDMQV
jgi:hypothetical protein